MDLKSESDLASTREKLAILEQRLLALRKETGGNEKLRKAMLQSLKVYINQFKEDIVRYEARHPAHS